MKQQVFECGCIMYYDKDGVEFSVEECKRHREETDENIRRAKMNLEEDDICRIMINGGEE